MRALVSFLVIALVTVLLAEFTLRVYHHFHPVFIFPSDSYNRFRGKPFERNYDFKLNAQGFNDVEFKKEKDAGVYRIIGIGDSFVFSVVPYKHNFLTLLEERLNARGKPRYEVINMGIPGANPEDYQSLLVKEGLELNPDMVILFVFIGNDLAGSPPSPWVTSYVASFISFLFHVPQQIVQSQANLFDYRDDQPSFGTFEEYFAIEEKAIPLYRIGNPGHGSMIRNAMISINGIQAICLSQGVRLLLVIIPDEMQVNKALQQAALGKLRLTAQEMDFDLPNRLLKKALQEADMLYLDLLEPFREASTRTSLYKPQDTHWNIAGNRLAAELIADHFEGLEKTNPGAAQEGFEKVTGARPIGARIEKN